MNQSGVLAGKRVMAVAAGNDFSMALCADGTVAAWGFNYDGELGDGTGFDSDVPVAVDTTTALNGRTVVAITAGDSHALALCADGTVASWGYNGDGRLGDNSTTDRWSPVAVVSNGVLTGKAVVAISAGFGHSLALCADGSVVSWGANESGQLGDGTVTQRIAPIMVSTTQGSSALSGKTVTAIVAGGYHSLALCADGTVTAWGFNGYGQLGDNSDVDRLLPVEVTANTGSSTLFGRRPDHLTSGLNHSIAWCSDGTVAVWGRNVSGQLGDASTSVRSLPVPATTSAYAAGERPVLAGSASSSDHSLSLAASFPAPVPVIAVEYPAGNGLSNNAGTADFGSLLAGDTNTATLTIRNTGNATLTGFTITKDGTQAAEFTVTGAPVSPVAPGRTTTFPITFAPLAAGARTATLHISSNDPANPSYTVQLMVTGTVSGTANAAFNSPLDVPLVANGYIAAGKTVNFTLNCVPPPNGLTVIRNTGPAFIQGRFANLAQGGQVTLSYNGVNYDFVANYYGGSGNDLVLVWAGTRVFGWGYNGNGRLGDGTTTDRSSPVAVAGGLGAGVLLGKTVVAVAAGDLHSLALCSDGTLAAWGYNNLGGLGDGTTTDRNVPVAVAMGQGSALQGKTVVAVAAGGGHSLALCADGTLAVWGFNDNGQLGIGNNSNSSLPVAVNTAPGSALCGKTVVAVDAGLYHSVALCSDGTLAAWGYNGFGALGDGTATNRLVPVAVNTEAGLSALQGKTVVAMSAGLTHNMALCSDGSLALWGENTYGQLGDGSAASNSPYPVAVNTAPGSALYGKTVVAMAVGVYHSVALCSDGTLAAWGWNIYGQLGDGTTSNRAVPVAVNAAAGSALNGRQVVAISAGNAHNLALCADGTTATWGYNNYGQLGDSTGVQRMVPVVVPRSGLAAGECFSSLAGGGRHTLGLVAYPGDPASSRAELLNLTISDGVLSPAFSPQVTAYTSTVDSGTTGMTVTPTVAGMGNLRVKGVPAVSGRTTPPISLVVGSNTITVEATSHDGTVSRIYTVTVIRPSDTGVLDAVWNTPADVPVTASSFTATSKTVNLTLNCVPSCNGLTVVRNTGPGFIQGRFANLAQGQTVVLSYGGGSYTFVADYYGGSGNDLVLVWADTRVFAWGSNDYGQLGDGTTVTRKTPVAVNAGAGEGILLGRTVVGAATGVYHSIAWSADGALATWGFNAYGQVGDGTTTTRSYPVALNTGAGSALQGKTLVAAAKGSFHSLAVCSDGTVAAWGRNNNNQLGEGTTSNSSLPVAVNAAQASALQGKTAVAVAAGGDSSLALCADGTLAAWGYNNYGQLGDGSTTTRNIPVMVNAGLGSALQGRTAVAVSAGNGFSLALCSDGTVVAWGYNGYGQLGDGTNTNRSLPVVVNAAPGSALYGKTVVAVAAGYAYSLALCSDGTLAAWGDNQYGQMGDGTTIQRTVPVAVRTTSGSALEGRFVVGMEAGDYHGLAVCADGTAAVWGFNDYGQIGDATTTTRTVPVAALRTALTESERFTAVRGGSNSIGFVANPGDPLASIASLDNLVISDGTLTPIFSPITTAYLVSVADQTSNIRISPTPTAKGIVTINGARVLTGVTSAIVPLDFGTNVVTVTVTSLDQSTAKTYSLSISRPAAASAVNAVFNLPLDVPVVTSGYIAAGRTVNFTLNCVPPSNGLTVIRNTGPAFIQGRFANLAQGGQVTLSYNGVNYDFVANYYGGSGNDLVLVWAGTRVFGWGYNGNGRLGDGTTTDRSSPVAVAFHRCQRWITFPGTCLAHDQAAHACLQSGRSNKSNADISATERHGGSAGFSDDHCV